MGAKSKTRVVLTGAGGAGCIEVIRALKESGRYYVVVGDASEHSAGFAFADQGYVLPWGVDPSFEEAFRTIIMREKPDFVIPLVDEEIPVVHRLVASEFPEVRVVAPRLEFCEQSMDKWASYKALAQADLPVAPSWLATDTAGVDYPAIIKPRSGRGSRGLAYLDSERDLRAYLRETDRPAEQLIVQRRLQGTEYTTSAVVGLGGPLLAVVPKVAVVKKGITQVGVTRSVPEIDALCANIQERLHADGPFNVQLIMGEDRIPYVFEINPRYSTTVALTLGAGIDEVDVVMRHAQGESIGSLDFKPDLLMIRYSVQMYVPESEWSPEKLP